MTKLATLNGISFASDSEVALDDRGVTLKLLDLAGWYSTTMRTNYTERENGDGDHVPGPSTRASKTMTLKAMVTSPNWDAVEDAWDAIAAVAGDGGDITLRYEDTDAGSVRVMRRIRVEGTIEPIPFAPRKAQVAIPLRAYDPRKYGEDERRSAPARVSGLQPVGAGLRYPLFTPQPGYSYQWIGTRYNSGSRQFLNGTPTRTNYDSDPSIQGGVNRFSLGGNWSRTWETGFGHTGTHSAKFTRTSTTPGNGYTIWGVFGLTPGQTYTMSVWTYGGLTGGIYDIKAANNVSTATTDFWTASNDWTRHSMTFVPTASDVSFYITDDRFTPAQFASPPAPIWMDDFLVELGTNVGDNFGGDTKGALPALSYGPLVAFTAAEVANYGRADAYPVFYISGGSMPNGFLITDRRTGRQVKFVGSVDSAETLVLDMRTKRIMSGQTDRTIQLVVNETMSIPGQSTSSYQFDTLGSSDSGTPTLLVGVTDTWW